MSLASPFLWYLIPSQLTGILIPYASQVLPGIFPPAQKGSPVYARNYRWIYTALIVGYLAWTWTSVDSGDDWYALLGVPRWAEDEDLKKAFRTLSRRYHPDRSSDPQDEHIFIVLRRAYETLSNPTKRFAYDRFGPDILTWGLEGNKPDSRTGEKKELGIREWVLAGLMRSVGFYIVSGGITAGLAILGMARDGSKYRQLLVLLLLMAELTILLSPTPPAHRSALSSIFPTLPPALQSLVNPLLIPFSALFHTATRSFSSAPQFLQVRVLHRLFTTLSISINQLAGVWSTRTPSAEEALVGATSLARAVEVDAAGEFQREVVPLLQLGQPLQVESALKVGMQQALVDRSISSHPGVRPLWQAAAQRAMAELHLSQSQNGGIGLDDTEIARRIPLPPSPPPSPYSGPRTL